MRQLVHDVDRRMIDVPGARLYAEARGPAQAPAVVLMGSLASDTAGWSQQVPALVDAGLRVVAFDYRGHGRSSTSRPPFTLSLFQQDLRAVVSSYALDRPHLVGLSLGGMIALGEASSAGDDYARIVVASTRADMPDPLAQAWMAREQEVRRQGLACIVEGTLERWFTQSFCAAHPDLLRQAREMILRTDAAAYADCIEIVRTIALLERLPAIRSPVLYLTGSEDPASPPALMDEMHRCTPGSMFALLQGAAHMPAIEQPRAFNRLVIDFLTS